MDNLIKIAGYLIIAALLGVLFFLGFVFFITAVIGFAGFIIFRNIKMLFTQGSESAAQSTDSEPKVFEAEYTIVQEENKLDDNSRL